MTIYKPKPEEKKENVKLPPEVVVTSEPLIEKAKVIHTPRAVPTRNSFLAMQARQRRTRVFVNCCIFLNAMILTAAGVMGGMYLYHHMSKNFVGKCGVNFKHDDTSSEMSLQHGEVIDPKDPRPVLADGQFDEQVELDIDNGVYEKIDVPEFLDCRRATILHDFERNTTAVIDKDAARCFVMPLDRALVKPPKDFWDLIVKLRTGYYLPDEQVVRQKFYVKLPPLQDLSPYGHYIFRQCKFYDTYQLVPSDTVNQGRNRRAAYSCNFDNLHYTYTGGAGATSLGIADILGCA